LVKQPGDVEAQAGKQQTPLQAKCHAVADANNKNNEQATQLNFKTLQKQSGGLAEWGLGDLLSRKSPRPPLG